MSAGRVILIIVGSIFALVGVALMIGGAVGLWAYTTQRDDGFLVSDPERFDTQTFALTSTEIDLGDDDWFWDQDWLTALVAVETVDRDGEVFAGIGPYEDVQAYLDGVPHEEISEIDWGWWGRDFDYDAELIDGTSEPAAPTAQDFWVAQVSGPGRQALEWDLDAGQYQLVVMNADGSADVDVEGELGIEVAPLLGLSIGALAVGLVVLVGAGGAIYAGARTPARPAPPGEAGAEPVPAVVPVAGAEPPIAAEAYPLRFRGELDPGLSRWQWLVKWFLAIPHFFVLFFLWVAFVAMTIVAFFAILFTARYPEGIFRFNVGVMRWTWRVWFYALSAIGTDRYPPFSLDPDPGYPADLEVDEPAELSRGLVLVKWWLLAIPHYLIIAAAGGGLWFGSEATNGGSNAIGLVPVLVVIAGVALLFTGRYPGGLFRLLMGLNRWYFRVVVYTSLMTDRYPPFRLDQGPHEPPPEEPTPEEPVAPRPDPGTAASTAAPVPPAASGPSTGP